MICTVCQRACDKKSPAWYSCTLVKERWLIRHHAKMKLIESEILKERGFIDRMKDILRVRPWKNPVYLKVGDQLLKEGYYSPKTGRGDVAWLVERRVMYLARIRRKWLPDGWKNEKI